MAETRTRSSRYGTLGLDVGLFGRVVRFVAGAAAIWAFAADFLIPPADPILLGEVALYFFFSLAVDTAAYLILGRAVLARMNPWVGTALILGPVIVVFALDLGPGTLQEGLLLYVGVSLIFNVFMGYGGCEVISIPSLLFRNRYTVYCPYNLLDAVEKTVMDRGSNA